MVARAVVGGARMTARVLPTEPGWWWEGSPERPTIRRVTIGSLDGSLVTEVNYYSDEPITEPQYNWRAPVAPIGSVPPEVYARDVREAYHEGRSDAPGDYWHATARQRDPDAGWTVSSARSEVADALTAHGLTPDEAARVVAGVAS